MVIEARPSVAGAEVSEHSVVGSLGSGEDSDDSEVDSEGSGGGVEQQVGSPRRLRRLAGLAHLLLHASAFTLFVDLIVVLVLPFAHLADHFVLLVLGPRTGRPSFADHSRVQPRATPTTQGELWTVQDSPCLMHNNMHISLHVLAGFPARKAAHLP